MRDVKDLSNTKGTYTKVINDNIQEVYSNYSTMNFTDFKNYIVKLVSKANDTGARRNFLFEIDRQRDKDNLLQLVNNAWLRGQGLGTNINDKFAR